MLDPDWTPELKVFCTDYCGKLEAMSGEEIKDKLRETFPQKAFLCIREEANRHSWGKELARRFDPSRRRPPRELSPEEFAQIKDICLKARYREEALDLIAALGLGMGPRQLSSLLIKHPEIRSHWGRNPHQVISLWINRD